MKAYQPISRSVDHYLLRFYRDKGKLESALFVSASCYRGKSAIAVSHALYLLIIARAVEVLERALKM